MDSKKPLKNFLGDLTYYTIALSTDFTPTNIGYVASYCKNKFGDDIEGKSQVIKRSSVDILWRKPILLN
jgi:hypothetical protein